MLELCFLNLNFSLPVLHNILNIVFAWKFYHFTCLRIPERYIIRITKYDYDKYFSIAAWRKLGGSCDAKVKGKPQKQLTEINIEL